MHQSWSVEYLSDRMEVLVLGVLDEPQRARTKTRPERGE